MDDPVHVPFFAPHLYIPAGVTSVDFYIKAFAATELRRFLNDDGSYHVSELAIEGRMFHLHELKKTSGQLDPDTADGTTVAIGLFVADVDAVVQAAIQAGARILSPARDYDYGYRQAMIVDPFGHQWLIEMRI